MARITLIVLLSLFAVTLSFALPENKFFDPRTQHEFTLRDDPSIHDNGNLIRNARSPQTTTVGGIRPTNPRSLGGNLNTKPFGGNFNNNRHPLSYENRAQTRLRYRL